MQLGNFGRKGLNYKPGIINLFNAQALDRKDNYISTFFSSIKSHVCWHWPKAEHNVFLLVIGAVFFSLRYLFRSIMGKRKKVDLIEDYKTAKRQAALRKKLTDDDRD